MKRINPETVQTIGQMLAPFDAGLLEAAQLSPELAKERFRDGIHIYAASSYSRNQWQNQYLIVRIFCISILLRRTSMRKLPISFPRFVRQNSLK
jgi:hypothetical protein